MIYGIHVDVRVSVPDVDHEKEDHFLATQDGVGIQLILREQEFFFFVVSIYLDFGLNCNIGR